MQMIGGTQAPAGQQGGGADLIKDGNLESFARDVIQESMRQPVLVDFWATWCGPCKQLTPVLEKVVKQAGGKVKLVKIDIDQNPELAQQLRVQSVPTVYAFAQGQPVTGFAGAQPESQIKALVEKLTGGPLGPASVDIQLGEAQAALEAGALDAAGGSSAACGQGRRSGLGGLARYLLAANVSPGRAALGDVPAAAAKRTAVTGAKSAVASPRAGAR